MIAYDRLSQIVPADQALAAKALATSLQGISGVTNLTLPVLATVAGNLQTTANLPLISTLSVPTPSAVANVFLNLGNGSGADGTVLLTDILGTAAGVTHTQALANTVSEFATMNLISLTSTYSTMSEVVAGDYGDPVAGPVIIPTGAYANTYANADVAFSAALIPGAQSQISTAVATFPAQVTVLNENWIAMSNQLILEQTQQVNAGLVFANITANDRNSVYAFVSGLPQYGLDTATGQVTFVIESVADVSGFTGQSIIASLRQAKNQQALAQAGIQTNSDVPPDQNPPPAQANLIPATVTAADGANLVIK